MCMLTGTSSYSDCSGMIDVENDRELANLQPLSQRTLLPYSTSRFGVV